MYRLIIADDEEIICHGIRDAIDWHKYGVEVAACVGDGLSLVKQAVEKQADVALVDIQMPGLDGLTAIGRIRQELPECEFIIFTAYEDFAYAKQAIDLGVMAYITKPVLKDEVIDKVMLAVRRLEKRKGQKQPLEAGDATSPVVRIKQYIRDHIESRVTLMEVAEHMQMNPAYLSRYFKEKTGVNFADYCRKIRMERAKKLLQTTSLKVYEIASRLGYQNAQNFATAFRESEGISPFAYRSGRHENRDQGNE
ncbi:MAG: response regulator [Clostridia bacterium]|nr:response regulator [Clostridia bacterium]